MKENMSRFITAAPVNHMLYWEATIVGPPDSPYVGGVFKLSIQLPIDYPLRQPNVTFLTPIYHLNIESGVIKSNVLMWKPYVTIIQLLFQIYDLLQCPRPYFCNEVQSETATMYQENKPEYFKIAREWTKKYAK